MDKLIRNTIIISILWLVILAVGTFYIYGYQRKIKTQLIKQEEKKSKRLTELRSLNNDLTHLINYYQRLHYISLKYKGTLASFESPGETFDYIRRELFSTNSSIKLNMDYIDEHGFKSMMKRKYELSGNGKFTDIYRLLWFLENGPVFYQIESLSLTKIDTENNDSFRTGIDEASFNLSMNGFDRTQGPKISEINRDFGTPTEVADIFHKKAVLEKPRTEENKLATITPTNKTSKMHLPQQNIAPASASTLPEINSSCQVLAITPFSVVMKDAKGRLIKLRKGDKIFGGNLADLNTQAGQAIFQFDSTFGNKSVILTTQK